MAAALRLAHFRPTTYTNQCSPWKVQQPNSCFLFPSLNTSKNPIINIKKQNPPRICCFHVLCSTHEVASPSLDVAQDEVSDTRLLAQNVPWSCTADDIMPLFEKYGTVVDIELSMYNKTRNRGLAFVTMASHEEAAAALSNLENHEFEGRVLKLNWAKPKKKPLPPQQKKPVPIHNLFVANLPFQARAKDLREFFNANGEHKVVSAEIIFLDNPRRSAGYGFVSFNTKEEAKAALSAFQGKEFMGRPIRVARSRRFLRQQTKEEINVKGLQDKANLEKEPSEVDKVTI